MSFKWYFWHNQRKSMLVLGPHGKDRKFSRGKANIVNPKVNSGCPPLTVNRIPTDCVKKYTWTNSTTCSTGGLPYWGFAHLWNWNDCRTGCNYINDKLCFSRHARVLWMIRQEPIRSLGRFQEWLLEYFLSCTIPLIRGYFKKRYHHSLNTITSFDNGTLCNHI